MQEGQWPLRTASLNSVSHFGHLRDRVVVWLAAFISLRIYHTEEKLACDYMQSPSGILPDQTALQPDHWTALRLRLR